MGQEQVTTRSELDPSGFFSSGTTPENVIPGGHKEETPAAQEQAKPTEQASTETATAETTKEEPGLPMGWPQDKADLFGGLAPDVQDLIRGWKKEQDSLLTRKSEEMSAERKRLGDLADLAKDPKAALEVLQYHQANPDALGIMRLVEQEPSLGPAVSKLLLSWAEAKKTGADWDPGKAFQVEPRFDLKKYADMDDDTLQAQMLEDPSLVRGLIKELSGVEERVRQMTAPLQARLQQEQQITEWTNRLDRAIATLPKELKDERGKLTAESLSEINTLLAQPPAEWAQKTPEERLTLAAERVLSTRKETAARKQGEDRAKEEERQRRQVGASAGPGTSPGGTGMAAEMSARYRSTEFPVDKR